MAMTDTQSDQKLILYVEDDEASALLIERLLGLYGYKLVHTTTGQAGFLSAISQKPDLIMVDIHLSDMDGYTLITQLKQSQELAQTPIIALTAYQGQEARRNAVIAGCDGYITKPINRNDFPLQISRFLQPQPHSAMYEREDAYLYVYKTQLLEKLNDRIQELTEANHILVEQGKQRDDLVLAASQTLRPPWLAIKGHIHSLLDDAYGDLQPRQREALKHVAERISGLDHLMENLLDLSELQADSLSLRRDYFDPNALLTEIIDRLSRHLQTADRPVLRFEYEIEPNLPEIYADRGRIRHLLMNLLNDGLKFGQAGRIGLAVQTTANGLEFQVREYDQVLTALEIDELQRELWHSPWDPMRIMTSGQERIISLFISKRLTEAHNGLFSIESTAETGTAFRVTIPIDLLSTRLANAVGME